ncbi:MAG: hypothetical protein OHK0021_01490 [Bryobacter sp.]
MPRSAPEHLIATAELLRPMLEDFVFIGGAITFLLVTDAAAGRPRVTLDVDAITQASTYAEYVAVCEQLRLIGFSEDKREGSPLCRWVQADLILDVMPLNEEVLGFSNRWYSEAWKTARSRHLTNDLEIRVTRPSYFLAMKFEAFRGRGGSDLLSSRDVEDIVYVVDGRPEILDEIKEEDRGLQSYLRDEFELLLEDPYFLDALPGYLHPDSASQARTGIILDRLKKLARGHQ